MGRAWLAELRLALRRVRREPGYWGSAGGTLGLGVAGIVAVGALASSVLSPLPYPHSDQLVAVWEIRDGRQRWVAPANYLDWRRSSATFAGLAAHDVRSVSVTVGTEASRERVAVVSGNFFEVLGVEAAVGRTFDPRYDPTFPDRVAVVSEDARARLFGVGTEALGRTFLVDGQSYRIVGVAPPELSHPDAGLFAWLRSPTEAPDAPGFRGDVTTLRDAWYFEVTGRLAAGASIGSARAELAAVAQRLGAEYPDSNTGSGTLVVPLLGQTIEGFRATLTGLALAVVLVLTASIFNVVHLTLARLEARRADAAVRLSLGASRSDLRRAVLVEGWLLGGMGALLGIALARPGLEIAVRRWGSELPRAGEVALTGSHALAAVAVALGVGTLVALLAWARAGVGSDLRAALGSRVGGGALVATQVAVSIAVATGTLLLSSSVVRLARVDPGFVPEGLTTFRVALPDAPNRTYAERITTYRDVVEALEPIAGVRTVALGSDTPLTMGTRAGARVDGVEPIGDPPDSGWQPVDPSYFDAVGMTLLRGRRFTRADGPDAPDVAVVNEAFVRTVLPDRDPLGASVTMGLDGHDRPLTIVGVVADTRTAGPAYPPGAVLYRPIAQTTRFAARSILVAVRSDPDVGAALLLETARAGAPGLPIYSIQSGDELMRPFRARQSTLLAIMAVFAAVTLTIAVVGMYGVGMHVVLRRRREIGVRLALGATAGRVTGHVLSRALRWALVGVPPGLALAFLVSRSIESLLFEVSASDPGAPAVITVGVLALVAAAFTPPARLAATTDPARATKVD